MLIIVNKPTYTALHGQSFHAFFIGENGHVCVPDEDYLTEYKPTEFFIPNLQKEAQIAYDSKNWYGSDKTFDRITAYCKAAGIAMPKVEYNCPA